MNKLRRILLALRERLTSQQAVRKHAQGKHRYWRIASETAYARASALAAEGKAGRARRARARGDNRHKRALFWKAIIRRQERRINRLEDSVETVEKAIAKIAAQHRVTVEGNRVRGGASLEQRLRVCAMTTMANYQRGRQPGYYAMSGGARDYAHGVIGYAGGRIWDCSTFVDAQYFCCGLPSPSGPNAYQTGGYTATQLAHGRRVSEAEARPGDLVLFLRYAGDRIGHHVEIIEDADRKVMIGHGDSAIDRAGGGSYDSFGDGLYEIRTYHR